MSENTCHYLPLVSKHPDLCAKLLAYLQQRIEHVLCLEESLVPLRVGHVEVGTDAHPVFHNDQVGFVGEPCRDHDDQMAFLLR